MQANLILSIETNAGGVAKSTISYNLAYEIAVRGYSVALLDIDPNESLTLFCGLEKVAAPGTMADVYDSEFKGDWPLSAAWQSKIDKIQVCRGGKQLHQTIRTIAKDLRGAYLLSDRLSDYPLPHDFVIIDCPATLEPLPLTALAASTHVLIPIQPEYKASQGAAAMIEWYYYNCKQLRLRPTPKILGMVPTRWKSDWGAHRSIVEELPIVCQNLGIQYFNPIRESADILNASGRGLPLGIYRPGKGAREDFQPIVNALIQELKEIRGQ
ncbi:MAG: Sporulation initiation inhibitor protein Soj [Chroococcidiopsis sp. SAG 2025]|uniref:ParA family protein n=1 Tax=Chroococcidiopsis sp. SAG 2025 TaxID=171389 RepID=UPI0029373BFB|nr:ParA family protein [Chroococcidiopsis sp. SAG 2025]MDV2998060.1 Sporulation initiation inhibitor protein Soj [Chroococcidiopsis sp. SAG 2025]